MDIKALKLLLVENNSADANWISEILSKHNWQKSNLRHVKKVEEAVDSLNHDDFDAILLDLSLPDSQGIESLNIVQQKAPQLPIVILTGTDNPSVAVQSLRQGAQDYLIKGEFEGKILTRSIRYAIERQRLEFKTRQQALMKKMLDRIRNSIDLPTILNTTVSEIKQFLNTEQVLIYRCESNQSEATTTASPLANQSNRFAVNQLISTIDLDSLDSIASRITSVTAVENNSIEDSSDTASEFRAVRSYLILPIWLSESVNYASENLTLPLIPQINTYESQEDLWGILVAYNTGKTRKWQDWEINFLQKLTTQVTIAIQQSQLCCQLQTANQKLQQLAILDGLTNIANRRYFDLVLNNEWHRLIREQQPLSLILCDIDYFKAYNDAYGHQQGDRCLHKIAQILQKSTRRPADLVARYGGEEFAVILPNTNAKGASFIANKIAREVARKRLPHQKSAVSPYVTCSIGVATTIPQSRQSSSSLIQTADRLLYQAKKAGRDRVAVDYQELKH